MRYFLHSFRIFERLGKLPRKTEHRGGTTKKPDLYKDWNWPKPIPKDLFKDSFGGTDYQWMILSQGRTGTHVHHDPHLTDAWNALISGHKVKTKTFCNLSRKMYKESANFSFLKYWAILPNDVYAEHYECSEICSDKFDDLYSATWFSHVLPQLRNETWFGKKVIETVQGPGEVIYMPHDMGHAVLNIDENVSVTENFLQVRVRTLSDSTFFILMSSNVSLQVNVLDELSKYFAYKLNVVQYDNPDSAKRVWRNLMQRDLPDGPEKTYAKEMYKQVRNVKPARYL